MEADLLENADGIKEEVIANNSVPSGGELPDTLRNSKSGMYFEFEKLLNGFDNYYNESSDSEEEIGANEDDSFNFEMCRIRRTKRYSSCISDVVNKNSCTDCVTKNEIHKENETSGQSLMDIDDIICAIREGFNESPPLANDDEFDDFDALNI